MKKILALLLITTFLISFIFAQPITTRAVENDEGQQDQTQARILTQEQIQEIKQERKRIRIQEGECPNNCTCTGSTVKCQLERGGREMTITAGNSGNIIIQTQGVDGTTSVILYHHNGKVYGEFDNETKEVRVMPDMVKDKVRERIERELTDEEIELDEDGIYQYRARKKVKLFGFIRARVRIRAKINSETGELERIRNSWWAFLASEDTELIIGAGCGTVSPDSVDECCQNKGYDLYDSEEATCVFSN